MPENKGEMDQLFASGHSRGSPRQAVCEQIYCGLGCTSVS